MKHNIKQAWQTIFEQCKVVDAVRRNGHFDITANKIKAVGGREPRLMAKWDSSFSVPEIFSKHGLGLIATSRGGYRIGHFNVFHKVETDRLNEAQILSRQVPLWMQSLSKELRERSEPGLLSACYAAGIMHEYAGSESKDIFPGIFGRLTTNKFNFTVGAIDGSREAISCDGTQFEIDASYESPEALLIVEAKNVLQEDFNLRQLYFPWRYLCEKTGKVIRPLFIMRSNEVISVCEYAFDKLGEMDSIRLVSARRYSFADTEVSIQDLHDVLSSIRRFKKAGNLIFPQADRMELVIDLCERLRNAPADADDIADDLKYVHRQGQYYGQAAHFLGLVEKKKASYRLTGDGERIFNLPYKRRQLAIAKQFLQYRVFANCLTSLLDHSAMPSTDMIAKWIVEDKWPMSGTTPKRRASTVIGWTRWLVNLTNDSI